MIPEDLAWRLLEFWEDPLYRVLCVVLAVEVLLLGVQVIWLVGQSLHLRRMVGLAKRFEAEMAPIFPEALVDDAAATRWVARARAWPSSVLRAFLDANLTATAGASRRKVVAIYRALGLLEEDLAEARSLSWRRRLLAMRRLSLMPDPSLREALLARRGDIFPIRILAVRVLAEMGEIRAVSEALRDLPLTGRTMEQPLFHALRSVPAGRWTELMAGWRHVVMPQVRRVLLVASATADPSACLAVLPDAARDPAPEVRVGAALAASKLRSEDVLEMLLGLAADPSWEVRAQAAAALGALGDTRALSTLTGLLSDPAWWTRQNAARSLGLLGEPGRTALLGCEASSGDPYARQAAKEERSRRDLPSPSPRSPDRAAPGEAGGVVP